MFKAIMQKIKQILLSLKSLFSTKPANILEFKSVKVEELSIDSKSYVYYNETTNEFIIWRTGCFEFQNYNINIYDSPRQYRAWRYLAASGKLVYIGALLE